MNWRVIIMIDFDYVKSKNDFFKENDNGFKVISKK